MQKTKASGLVASHDLQRGNAAGRIVQLPGAHAAL